MSEKSLIMLGASIGGIAGDLLPSIWGAGAFSGWSVLTGLIGGLLGIYVMHQLIS